MLRWLLTLFILVPLGELYLLFEVAEVIGGGWTVAMVILTGVLGSVLVRRQGLRILTLIRKDMEEGRMPADRILHGVMVLVGGAFLLTPGIVTDLAGFLLMVPGNRRILLRYLRSRMEQHIQVHARGPGMFYYHSGGGHRGPTIDADPPGGEPRDS